MLLANVYVNHGEALEYDLFKIWGQDINHPLITVRRLRNFFERLPVDSETLNDIAEVPREGRAWSVDTWMLANVIDAIAHLDWVTVAVNSKHAPRPPKPFTRPAMKKIVKSKKAMWPGKTIVDRGKAGI